MEDNQFDLAIVDPPYGIGRAGYECGSKGNHKWKNPVKKTYEKKDWDDEIPNKEYFTELMRVSENQIIWGGNNFIEHLYNTTAVIAWDKEVNGNFSEFELAWTSFESRARLFKWMWNGFRKHKIEERFHPAQKPVALYKWLLKNYAKEGDTILDTHLGSGSSRIAAHDMGFDFTGYEVDKDYFDAQEKRFKHHIQQQSLFKPNDMYQ
jgi:site-specific DNA-methyltransferase (adenine-specific)